MTRSDPHEGHSNSKMRMVTVARPRHLYAGEQFSYGMCGRLASCGPLDWILPCPVSSPSVSV